MRKRSVHAQLVFVLVEGGHLVLVLVVVQEGQLLVLHHLQELQVELLRLDEVERPFFILASLDVLELIGDRDVDWGLDL